MIAAVIDELGVGWSWVLAGLALMGAELLLSGIFLVWLGLAALATGLAVALVPAAPWPLQLLLFALLAVGSVLAASRWTRAPANRLNQGARGLIGRAFPLDAPITGGLGRIRVNDTVWRVAGPDAPAGTPVRVTGIEGTTLLVTPA